MKSFSPTFLNLDEKDICDEELLAKFSLLRAFGPNSGSRSSSCSERNAQSTLSPPEQRVLSNRQLYAVKQQQERELEAYERAAGVDSVIVDIKTCLKRLNKRERPNLL